ncbi:type II secretion system protein N [Alkalilimnicola ehrlichii MLHE-1]|uniref:Type II secretion system protein N n=1 Tax=Alkalilimnicola ehrlichii (strain ATCC BAA-1101 / DSM 17681 / MLHE-1) TaxID=187272 RepID=Q0A614_ALKEH|nr:type II secretion system protein N [Alkalilimnicola ehrlichii]ABI57723.1 type II secretion system protein N [Alkalilimnicola ehrlichii MLHE-1]
MRRWLLGYTGWFLLALLAWGAFLIGYWPAGAALALGERQGWLPPEAGWAGASGSVWSGTLEQPAWQHYEAQRLSWTVQPGGLLRGQADLRFHLREAGADIEGRALVAPDGGVELRDVRLRLEAARLRHWVGDAAMGPVALDGTFRGRLDAARLEPDGRVASLDGRLLWHAAAVQAPMALPLGDLSGNFTGADGQLEGQLQDHGGPLRLDARVSVDPALRWRLEGRVGHSEQAPGELRQALGMLGRPDGDGLYPIRLEGRFTP